MKALFDPKDEIGLGFDGHIRYTAARTKLINDHIEQWLASTEGNKQVLNMGAGVDTRVFWQEALKNATTYIEVDTKPVLDSKQKILDELKGKGELNDALCERKTISLDFSTESTKDIPTHGFNAEVPTCWVLEGLIMYLEKEANMKLMEELADLSAPGSYVILNSLEVAQNPKGSCVDYEKVLMEKGFTKQDQLFFGQEKFNYGMYPEGKPAGEIFCFTFYKK